LKNVIEKGAQDVAPLQFAHVAGLGGCMGLVLFPQIADLPFPVKKVLVEDQ
jgi:hypothetical protein